MKHANKITTVEFQKIYNVLDFRKIIGLLKIKIIF